MRVRLNKNAELGCSELLKAHLACSKPQGLNVAWPKQSLLNEASFIHTFLVLLEEVQNLPRHTFLPSFFVKRIYEININHLILKTWTTDLL